MSEVNRKEVEKIVDSRVRVLVSEMLKGELFTARKLADTPTDNLSVVNRAYVNLNGSLSLAPKGSIVGQQYFATDLGYPIFKNQNSRWVNSAGSVVG